MNRKLLLVGIDGVRLDIAREEWVAPTLMDLVAAPGGSLGTVWMPAPTLSGPGWATLLTGVTPDLHGVRDNEFVGHRLQYHPDLLSRVWFANPHARTAAAVAWHTLVDPAGAGPVIHSRIDQQRREQHRLIVRSAIPAGAAEADKALAAIMPHLVRDGVDATFVHLESVDEAAHGYASTSPEYRTALSIVDGYLRPAIQAIEDRRAVHPEETWALAVTTDHGQSEDMWSRAHGGDSEAERRSFLAVRWFGPAQRWGEPVPGELQAHEVAGWLLRQLGA